MSETAWLAGLLEGEGSFMVYRRSNRRPALIVKVKMTDKDVVERAAVLMGGNKVTPEKDKRENNSDCWVARSHGQKAAVVMKAVRPYMGQRRGAKIDELLAMSNLSHHPKEAT